MGIRVGGLGFAVEGYGHAGALQMRIEQLKGDSNLVFHVQSL